MDDHSVLRFGRGFHSRSMRSKISTGRRPFP